MPQFISLSRATRSRTLAVSSSKEHDQHGTTRRRVLAGTASIGSAFLRPLIVQAASPMEAILDKAEWPEQFPFGQEDFGRYDENNDAEFYASPRFVTHIDDLAIEALTKYYASVFPSDAEASYLDLCSSWISHYPTTTCAKRIAGLGMNKEELARNSILTDYEVHDLNRDPKLPYDNSTFDVITNAVSVDYLAKPLEIFREMHRVLKPGGLALMSFSNRCFPTKVIQVWSGTGDADHILIVGSYFHYSVPGGFERPKCADITPKQSFFRRSDPMYVVYSRKTQQMSAETCTGEVPHRRRLICPGSVRPLSRIAPSSTDLGLTVLLSRKRKFLIAKENRRVWRTYAILPGHFSETSQHSPNGFDLFESDDEEDVKLHGDVRSYTVMIRDLILSNKLDEAEKLFAEMSTKQIEPNVVTYTTMIRGYHLQGKLQEAERLFSKMLRIGIEPTTVTYTAMMRGYQLAGANEKVLEWFDKMLENDVKPNYITLGTLLAVYSESGDIKKAVEFLKRFRSMGIEPDISNLNALITMAIKAKDLRLTERLFDHIDTIGLKKCRVTYNSMIDAYAELGSTRNGDTALADGIRVRHALEADGYECDLVTYNGLIKLFVRHGDIDGALQLFEEMKAADIRPDIITYTSLISGYARTGRYNDPAELSTRCKALLLEMEEQGIQPNVYTFNSLLKLCVTMKDHAKTMQIYAFMKTKSVKPDAVTIGTIIDSYAKHSGEGDAKAYIKKCFQFLDEMDHYSIQLNCKIVSTLVWACARVGDMSAAQDLLRRVDREKISLNGVVYTSLVKLHLSVGDLFGARRWMAQMKQQGFKPNIYTYNSFLSYYAKIYNRENAIDVLMEMQSNGVVPGNLTLRLLEQLGIEYT